MDYETITSPQNARVKNLVRLREGQHRRREGKFIIEGRRELARALEKNLRLEELYFSPEWFQPEGGEQVLAAAARQGAALFRLAREVFAKCSYREGPDGLLGVAKSWQTKLADLRLAANPMVVVAERLEKPGNLGALLRTADAAGADAVIVADEVADLFNPNVIRASQGSCFALPTVATDRESAQKWLQEKNMQLVAATPAATLNHWEADLTRPTAILLGSEKSGLTDFWLQHGALPVKIPMAGQADSLNVSAAAAVFLFEAVRQRMTVRPPG